MAKFVLAYQGGGGMAEGAPPDPAVMEQWMNWFGALGESVVDPGSPFAPAAKTISSDGKVSGGGGSALSGYSIISADSLDAATEAAKGCPVLSTGGSIDVYEALPVG